MGVQYNLQPISDMTYDKVHNQFYFYNGASVFRFDPVSAALTKIVDLGHYATRMDVSADGSKLILGEGQASAGWGPETDSIYQVNLADGSYSTLHFTTEKWEGGIAQIIYTSDGGAIMTTYEQYSGPSYLRTFDPNGSSYVGGMVKTAQGYDLSSSSNLFITPSETHRFILVQTVNYGSGASLIYDVATKAYISANGGTYVDENNSQSAITEKGYVSLLGYHHLIVTDFTFKSVADLSSLNRSGEILASRFSEDGRQLMLWDHGSNLIRVYDTQTWTEVGAVPVSSIVTRYSSGSTRYEFELGDHGRTLALFTDQGFEVVDMGANLKLDRTGDDGANTLYGASGIDTLSGGGGADQLWGGWGNDSLVGGSGAAQLHGEQGDDSLSGGSGANQLYGGEGQDVLRGGSGAGTLYGDAGNDTLYAGSGGNELHGGDGADHLQGGDGRAHLYGDAGNDDLRAGGGADTLSGGDGDDTLTADVAGAQMAGDAGNDTIQGGFSADTISDSSGSNYLRGGDGNDQISGGSGFDDINGNQGNDTAHGNDGDDWVVGGKDNDVLYGDAGNDIVYGNLGDDTISGGDGNDWVRGGQGNDSVSGGNGDDLIYGDRGNDTISGGTGADSFRSFSGAGVDRVLDFSSAEGDHVQLDPGTTYTLSQAGADTVVDMGGGDQLIVVGVTLSTLPAGWITVG